MVDQSHTPPDEVPGESVEEEPARVAEADEISDPDPDEEAAQGGDESEAPDWDEADAGGETGVVEPLAADGADQPSGEPGEESPGGDRLEEPTAGEPAEAAEPVPDNKNWYVVKVQSGREESIKEAIERRVKIEGLEEYYDQILIPMEKETILNKKTNKRITRERKKFPGYIMARVEYNDQILYLFRETSGVGDFVGGGPNHPPLPMTEREVQQMIGVKKPDESKGPSPLEPEASPFHVGDRVQVKDGVFTGMEGEVKDVLINKGQVRVELFVLGRPVGVELEYWQVEGV